MVVAHIGDDIEIPLHHVPLGHGLELRLHRHALQNEDLRPLAVGPADHPQLLADAGGAQAADLMLHAVYADIAGGRPGGLGKHPIARPPQVGVD